MDGKLELYRVFAAVAKNLSFSLAAQELFMTQSAVSQSIKQLETRLGVKLFARSSKTVSLTGEGELLYEYVHTALGLISNGEQQLSKVKDLLAGELCIGAGDTISHQLLLPYLEQFHSKYPNVKLKIINRTTLDAVSLLKAGRIDLAFANLPLHDASLNIMEYCKIHDVFAASTKYAELKGKTLTYQELAGLPLIFLEKSSNSRNYVETYLQEKGIKLKPEIELGSHDLLLEFAKINLGISCVIREFSKSYFESDILCELTVADPVPPRAIGICTLSGVPLSAAASRFLELLPVYPDSSVGRN